jgi:host factor-I protein
MAFEPSAQKKPLIQEAFLRHLCDSRTEVMMFLVNGIRLQGWIRRYDNYTVQLMRGDSSQIIYKHAISAISPAEPVKLISLAD